MSTSIKRLAIALFFPPLVGAIVLMLLSAVVDGGFGMGPAEAVQVAVVFALYGAIFCLPATLGLWIVTEVIERRRLSLRWHAVVCVAFGVIAGAAIQLVAFGSNLHIVGIWVLVGAVVGLATSRLLQGVRAKV